MATYSPARPDLTAHQRALRLPISAIVGQLIPLLGRKLTAYIGGVKDIRAVDRWAAGGEIYGDAEPRLRFAFQVAETLANHDSPLVIRAWLTGVNPELGDRVPIRFLREGDLHIVAPSLLGAARAFIAGA